MSDNKLVLKSISQLLEYRFYIPAYQRGYRWNTTQVTQLLDDIWEFALKSKTGEEFYCLQPIVVKSYKNSEWEVIDGQQRLTTIRIFLSYLVKEHLKRPLKEAFRKEEFHITYETRPKSEEFLTNIEEDISNVDYYYMWYAFQTTIKWFSDKDYNDCNKFLSTLLAKKDEENPVKVIWYEVNEEVDAIDVFTRLNIGKIPLTNSELIRALFLGTANPDNVNQKANYKQLQIASEWNAIENKLQEDSFWYFIYDKGNDKLPKHPYDTRIEYIFDLMKNKSDGEEMYFTFYKFQKEDFQKKITQNGDPDIEAIWLSIKKYFLTFEEWYNDRDLYHLIGFLITTGSDLKGIIAKSHEIGLTKTEFKTYLKKEIAKKVNFDIDELDYSNNKDKLLIKRVLLLMNIQTHLSNAHSKSRFPFDSYKNGNWDIEHVRSQSEVELKGKDRIAWAKLVFEFYTGSDYNEPNNEIQNSAIIDLSEKEKSICLDLEKTIKSELNEEEYNKLYQGINEQFKEKNPPSGNNIYNLVLLDAGTNRAYKNVFFPVKRMHIMKRDMKGEFIPICTKNVFMKAYSRRFDKIMYWEKSDAEDYLKALKDCLSDYLKLN